MSSSARDREQRFLASEVFAVVGASNQSHKYGAKVFAAYLEQGLKVYPVNPRESEIQGHRAYASLADIPERVHAISVITPPAVTEKVVEDAAAAGVNSIWMQPGAESEEAVRRAEELGLEVISGGPCILVTFTLG